MAHEARTSSHYSRMPGIDRSALPSAAPVATRAQTTLERILFFVFGGMLALGAFALYATTTASHNDVRSRLAAGLASDRVNVLFITTETQRRFGRPVEAAASVSVLSIRPSTRESVLIVLTLHLWAELGKHGHRPLGAAFEVGNAAGSPGGGVGLTMSAVERTTGLPVHGYARVATTDLAGIIDRLGGITIDVPHGVYETRSREPFARGRLQLNGERAVLYGFSRDVARPAHQTMRREERRQAVVASALRSLIATPSQPEISAVETNLETAEVDSLRRLVDPHSLRTVDLAPHLVRVRKTTAVYDGEAFVPRADVRTELRRATSAAFAAHH